MLGHQACAAKSNEITAIPLLLNRLTIRGALVTIDAMGCQIGGVRFLGCTLWTDYALQGEAWQLPAMAAARDGMNDYSSRG